MTREPAALLPRDQCSVPGEKSAERVPWLASKSPADTHFHNYALLIDILDDGVSVRESMCRCLLTASCLGFCILRRGKYWIVKEPLASIRVYNVNSSPLVVPDLFKLTVNVITDIMSFVRFSGTSARFPHECLNLSRITHTSAYWRNMLQKYRGKDIIPRYMMILWYINSPKNYIYIYICTHTHTHIYMYTYTCTFISCIHIYIYIHTHTHTHTLYIYIYIILTIKSHLFNYFCHVLSHQKEKN